MSSKQKLLTNIQDDLVAFGRIVSPRTFYMPSPVFHYELSELLLSPIEQLLIKAPRGFGKSTMIIFKILHHIVFDEGDKLVIIQSKTRPEAINRLTKIKNIMEYSAVFRGLFGYMGEEVAQMWREDKIKTRYNNNWITIRAIGTGQPARGSLEDDTRITLFILDDPEDEDNTKTKEAMMANFDKFLGVLPGLDRRNGRVIIIGTPIRGGCIVDRLDNATGWETRSYKAMEGDKLLWPEYRNKEWLDSKKKELEEQGRISKYFSEYQCEIVGDEDQLFKEEYLRYWDGYLSVKGGDTYLHISSLHKVELAEEIVKPVNVFMGIDPASSTKQTADFSVTMSVAYDSEKNIYVLPYYRRRVKPTEHAEQIIEKIKSIRPKRGHVETVGYQEMLRQYLRERLEDEDIFLPGLETKFNPRTEKSARLEGLHAHFYNHKVYIQPNMTELIEEVLMYPRSKNDDLLDGLYYATIKMFPPDIMEVEESEDREHLVVQRIKRWRRV